MPWQVLRVAFVADDNTTEVGHGGGVTKEFLHLFGLTAFNPHLGLFIPTEQHRLYPNPSSHLISADHLEVQYTSSSSVRD